MSTESHVLIISNVTLFQDFKRLLFNSKNTYLKQMWPEGADHITKTTKRPLTAGTLFKNSMLALMKTIHSKEPHYVRCIKPNDAKSPVLFDRKLVEHQVRMKDIIFWPRRRHINHDQF